MTDKNDTTRNDSIDADLGMFNSMIGEDSIETAGDVSPANEAAPAPKTGGQFSRMKPAEKKRALAKKDRDVLDQDWMSDLARDTKGKISKTPYNLGLILENEVRLRGRIAFNEFSSQIVIRDTLDARIAGVPVIKVQDDKAGDELQDIHIDVIRTLISAPVEQDGYDVTYSEKDVTSSVRAAAHNHRFDPVKDYLRGLEWDGEKRVEALFIDYLGAEDNEYTRETALKFLMAAVARVEQPGIKFDSAVILEGGQGAQKSAFINALGRGWFSDLDENAMVDTARGIEAMSGAWICEIPELNAMRGKDINAVKAFMSRQIDRVRLAYDKHTSSIRRRSVLMGTTNLSQYLQDPTGGRRWWPIKLGLKAEKTIDLDRLEMEIDQIWAEAVALYDEGCRIHDNRPHLYLEGAKAKRIAKGLQRSRTSQTAEETQVDDVVEYLSSVMPFNAAEFDANMHERVTLDDGSDGMRIVALTGEYAWAEILEKDIADYKGGVLQAFTSALSNTPGIEKSPGKKVLPDGYGKTKRARYYSVDYDLLPRD